MCKDLLNAISIAVDTESNSLHAYQERVCLIQFSVPGTDYLVDPLAIGDLSSLAPLFSIPTIQKIFHAAEYDLICLKRDYHFHFENIFDTMLAARILGYPAFGLGAILEEKFGIVIDKRYQKADWAKRPMSAVMLSYARMDTHYLVQLKDLMTDELIEKQMVGLAEEDFKRISKVNGSYQDGEAESFWKVHGSHDLTPSQAAVLKELSLFRIKEARRRDLPPFKIMSNEFLMMIAESCPLTLDDLLVCDGNIRLMKRYGQDLLAAVKKGLKSEPAYPPKVKKCELELKNRIEALKIWRKKTAAEFKVESDVILPRELLIAIAEKKPSSINELSSIMENNPWRFEHFGSAILSKIN